MFILLYLYFIWAEIYPDLKKEGFRPSSVVLVGLTSLVVLTLFSVIDYDAFYSITHWNEEWLEMTDGAGLVLNGFAGAVLLGIGLNRLLQWADKDWEKTKKDD